MVRIPAPSALLLVAAFAVPAPALHAQVVTLDEGTMRIWIDGQEAGTESFTIRRDGLGSEARIIAAAQVSHAAGPLEMRPTLSTDAELRPVVYENTITGTRSATVSLVLNGRRYTSTVVSRQGEAEREFRAGGGTLVLEPRVASLYWFVSPHLDQPGTELHGIEPESGNRPTLVLREVVAEELRIGRRAFDARKAVLEGGGDVRRVWFDDQGRLLRVEVPAQGFVAERIPEG